MADSTTAPTGVVSARNFRKRRRDEDSGDEEAVQLDNVRNLREDQRLRTRKRGLDAEELARAVAVTAAASVAAAPGTSYGPMPSGAHDVGKGMAAFRSGMDDLADGDSPAMQAYIAARIAELTGGGSAALTTPAAAAAAPSKDDAWLYEIPEHLQPVSRAHVKDADVAEGGMMLGGTGIAEVALPVDVQERNVAATMKMRDALLAKHMTSRHGAEPPASMRSGKGKSAAEG